MNDQDNRIPIQTVRGIFLFYSAVTTTTGITNVSQIWGLTAVLKFNLIRPIVVDYDPKFAWSWSNLTNGRSPGTREIAPNEGPLSDYARSSMSQAMAVKDAFPMIGFEMTISKISLGATFCVENLHKTETDANLANFSYVGLGTVMTDFRACGAKWGHPTYQGPLTAPSSKRTCSYVCLDGERACVCVDKVKPWTKPFTGPLWKSGFGLGWFPLNWFLFGPRVPIDLFTFKASSDCYWRLFGLERDSGPIGMVIHIRSLYIQTGLWTGRELGCHWTFRCGGTEKFLLVIARRRLFTHSLARSIESPSFTYAQSG